MDISIVIPAFNEQDNVKVLYDKISSTMLKIDKNYEKQEFHKVLEKIWLLISNANKYVDSTAPWKLVKKDLSRAGDVLNILVVFIAKIGIYLYPIMPTVSENILTKVGIHIIKVKLEDINNDQIINLNHKIKKPEIIFNKIDE